MRVGNGEKGDGPGEVAVRGLVTQPTCRAPPARATELCISYDLRSFSQIFFTAFAHDAGTPAAESSGDPSRVRV